MKRILDRLMARQHRLMESLGPSEQSTRDPLPSPRAPPAPESLAAEEAALEAAFGALAEGNEAAAESLLLPFEAVAGKAKTLTTLARLKSNAGDFDAALALLFRAEALDRTDRKVWYFLAEHFRLRRDPAKELHYRRRLAYADKVVPAERYIELMRAIVGAAPRNKQPLLSEIKLAYRKIRAAEPLSADQHINLAKSLYAVDALRQDARAHYMAAAPCQEHQLDVTASWVRLQDWCAQESLPLVHLKEDGVPGRRPKVASLRDVWVLPHFQWTPVMGNGRAVPSGFATSRFRPRDEAPTSPLLMWDSAHAELRVPRNLPVIDTPALLVGGIGHYYHDTIEYFSALAVANTAGIGMDLPIVVNDDLAPHQIELLGLLGYSGDRLIRLRSDQPVAFKHLVVPTRLAFGGRWIDPLLPQWYRQRLAPAISTPATRKLYLSRSTAVRRRVDNEDELVVMLAAQGYEIIRPEHLTVRRQISLFATASHIVAPTGAALTNMIYAPPGAAITVLYNRLLMRSGGDLYFDALAEACGHRITKVECRPASRVVQRSIDADLLVDIATVRSALN